MISLGGITLNDNLIWENRFTYPRNSFSRRPTLRGRIIVQYSPVDGRLISLSTISVGISGTIGYFTKTQIDSIREFENNMNVVPFVYESDSLTVIVQPGGLEIEAAIPRPNHSAGDWFMGTIHLIEKGN